MTENKGEWIEMKDNHGHSSYFCSRCGTQEGKPYDVCQNCNADMQKGGSKPGVQANLKEVLVPYCNITFDTEKLKELTDGIVEQIRNGELILQTESATEWIPVSERLPEEKTNPITNDYYDYFCTFHLDDIDDVRVYKFGNGHWWFYGSMMDDFVTAWMPRPEPWKGE